MAVKKEWLAVGTRVITPCGAGAIADIDWPNISVRLSQPIVERNREVYSPGNISLDTAYMIIKIMMTDGVGMITHGFNAPDLETGLEYINSVPYAEDETLLLLNFEDQSFTSTLVSK